MAYSFGGDFVNDIKVCYSRTKIESMNGHLEFDDVPVRAYCDQSSTLLSMINKIIIVVSILSCI
jgi:hypothetical protein